VNSVLNSFRAGKVLACFRRRGKIQHGSSFQTAAGHCFWLDDFGAAVKRFGYLRDPLFLICSSLYAVNRWLIRPHVHSAFLRFHFNDLLLMPCALPPLLLMQRWLRLRQHDEFPTGGEIALYLIVWSILFEVVGPHLMHRATGDIWDVAAYVCGAILAGIWWHRDQIARRFRTHEL
jgi:hypothetical protein